MSEREPEVLHEWEDAKEGERHRVLLYNGTRQSHKWWRDGVFYEREGSAMSRELARLAARVRELEGERDRQRSWVCRDCGHKGAGLITQVICAECSGLCALEATDAD